MIQQEDILWKGVLQEIFDDFLRFFYPEADKIFDLNRGVTFLDKELSLLYPSEVEESRFSAKVVDKLVKVYTQDGSEEWVLIHLEIQGTFRNDFAFRMFTYYYRILDRYQRRVAACAILTEPVLKPRSDVYEHEFLDTSIRYQFKVYKIAEQDEEFLRASDNLFALVVLIAKSKFIGRNIEDREERDQALLAFKRELLRRLRSRSIPEKKINALLLFLRCYVQFENIENEKIFFNEIQNEKAMKKRYEGLTGLELLMEANKATDRYYARLAIKERREKDRKEARAEIEAEHTRRLLTFTDHSEEEIAKLMNVPVSFVQQIRAKLQEETKKESQESL